MDKAAFLVKREAKTRDVDTGLGTVTVRALTRTEVKALHKYRDDDDHDLRLVTAGIVDPDGLTLEDVAEWAGNAPVSEYMDVLQAINELSGVNEGAQKSDLPGD